MRYTNALLFLSALLATSTVAEPLTVERIFAAPDLSGPRLRMPAFSPDGRYVAYLQGKQDNKDQLDLWAFDARTGESKLLVDSRALIGDEEQLSAEEEARRERQRTASLRGIVEYEFSSDGRRLLIPLGGDLYLYDLKSNGVTRLTATDAYETDARFSPRGGYVSFIREQNLFAIDLRTRAELQLTSDGAGLVQNGVAEFIAQEEMGRNTGYWWSPDEKRIAFTRIDDSPVMEVERFEINADGARMFRQRYPAAGTANTKVELKVLELATRAATRAATRKAVDVDLQLGEGYLGRVDWFPLSRHLAVQRQTRDQKRLDLLKVDASSGAVATLLTETSPHWIELHDDLKILEKSERFIWSSRRSGYKHLYLYDFTGALIRLLTAGEWMVVGEGESGLVGVDEARGLVYFMANEASALERHLYVASLDTTTPQKPRRITREAGWHEAKLAKKGDVFLDQWSSPDQPPTASLRGVDGSIKHWLVRNALDATHPYFPYKQDHVAEEFGQLKAADGQTLHYRFLRPARMQTDRRYPAVIDTYGGPHFQYVKKDWMGGARAAQGYFRQVLAQNGFAVLTLDNRGSGYRGETFEKTLANRLGAVEVEDQLRGADFLKSHAFIDPERIGIMGWSYGGYMTLKAMTTTNAFRAGVAGAPVVDWRLYDTHYTERYLSTPLLNASGYTASGVDAKSLRGALLLVHGMADDNVLFTNSTMLMQQLQALGAPFDVMTYPGGKHGVPRMAQQGRHYYEMVLRFFTRELCSTTAKGGCADGRRISQSGDRASTAEHRTGHGGQQ